MQVQFQLKDVGEKEAQLLRDYVEAKLPQFEKFLTHFAEDAVDLRVNAKRFEKNNAYRIEFIGRFPSQTIVAREDSHTIEKGVDLAKDRFLTQLKKYLDELQNEFVSARKHGGLYEPVIENITNEEALMDF
ncbi:MAG: HPF/RaiA family ribosome-associated protein [Patescibacteria group bacterium]|nr:HPF/RaiA family ribosome-associated protein [Patescibacteria group bacterium]